MVNGWEVLPVDQVESLTQEIRQSWRWSDLDETQLLSALDGEAYYMRYHADLSEPVRALRGIAIWFGIYLSGKGWRWVRNTVGALGVLSPDNQIVCDLKEVTATIFSEDDAPVFSKLANLLAINKRVKVKGVIYLKSKISRQESL